MLRTNGHSQKSSLIAGQTQAPLSNPNSVDKLDFPTNALFFYLEFGGLTSA